MQVIIASSGSEFGCNVQRRNNIEVAALSGQPGKQNATSLSHLEPDREQWFRAARLGTVRRIEGTGRALRQSLSIRPHRRERRFLQPTARPRWSVRWG